MKQRVSEGGGFSVPLHILFTDVPASVKVCLDGKANMTNNLNSLQNTDEINRKRRLTYLCQHRSGSLESLFCKEQWLKLVFVLNPAV
jgi:hypothetical protein